MTTEEQSVEATNSDDQGRPEPFATILELIGEYGAPALLDSISDVALFDSENEENCHDCRALAAQLHLELEELQERMRQFKDALNAKTQAAPQEGGNDAVFNS
jgi:hypothetical protein